MVQTVPGAHKASYSVRAMAISWRKISQGFVLTSPLHLAPRLSISGALPLSPLMPLWRGKGQVYIYLITRVNIKQPLN